MNLIRAGGMAFDTVHGFTLQPAPAIAPRRASSGTTSGAQRPTRPLLRYPGGKFRLAPYVIRLFPRHTHYVEPCGGAGSTLILKPRSTLEVLNDLDARLHTLFQVLQDPAKTVDLEHRLRWTPFSRREFELSFEPVADGDPVEIARRLIARSFLGHSSMGVTRRTGFRRDGLSRGTPPPNDWCNYPDHLKVFAERLRGVILENRPALDVLADYDHPETLVYCDPPYPMSTRSFTERIYVHEMTDDDHRALAERLRSMRSMVIVSGYPCPLYDEELYADWERFTFSARTANKQRATDRSARCKRTEVLWINAAARNAMQGRFEL